MTANIINGRTALPNSILIPATIPNGAALSGVFDCGEARLAGVFMPAAWTAAALTLQVSPDGTTFFDAYDEFGVEMSYAVAASRFVKLPLLNTIGVRRLRVRSGTAATPVNQGGERLLRFVAEP